MRPRHSAKTRTMSELRTDPRALMALRLPRAMQPLLTWLTSRPAPSERARVRAPWTFLLEALAWTVLGLLAGIVGFATHGLASAALIALVVVTHVRESEDGGREEMVSAGANASEQAIVADAVTR